jgi:hypothetical protein
MLSGAPMMVVVTSYKIGGTLIVSQDSFHITFVQCLFIPLFLERALPEE